MEGNGAEGTEVLGQEVSGYKSNWRARPSRSLKVRARNMCWIGLRGERGCSGKSEKRRGQ